MLVAATLEEMHASVVVYAGVECGRPAPSADSRARFDVRGS
jgi:hypothetical protein